jgi:hypothetical protein
MKMASFGLVGVKVFRFYKAFWPREYLSFYHAAATGSEFNFKVDFDKYFVAVAAINRLCSLKKYGNRREV